MHSARTNPGTAHTPGPWSSISADGYSRIIAGNSEFAGIVVYNTNGFSPSDEERVFFETRAANARLIAAAPELLVSLTDLLRYLDDHDWGTVPEGATADRARAAIAKATGASHV